MVVLWLVSVMSHHLNFTYSYCDLTYILHSNKQSGYPAWPLHMPRLTHLTLSQLTVCGSMDRWHKWIQRVLWHRWLMSIVPISKVPENIMKVNRWTFILPHFPLKDTWNLSPHIRFFWSSHSRVNTGHSVINVNFPKNLSYIFQKIPPLQHYKQNSQKEAAFRHSVGISAQYLHQFHSHSTFTFNKF